MKLLLILVFGGLIAANDEFKNANNLFSSTLYKELAKTETGNFLVSPFSAETILALTLLGCRGQTAQQLQSALHLPNPNVLEKEVKELLPKLGDEEHEYTLRIANKMYVKNNFIINNEFKRVVSEAFSAESECINFTRKIKAAKVMNSWVEQQTENKIQNLVSPDILDEYTRLVLINALYFKGNWSEQFSRDLTQSADFYKDGNQAVKADFMENVPYYNRYVKSTSLDAKFLEMPFSGSDAAMVFVLPNTRTGLAKLEANIGEVFRAQNFQWERVKILVPKFRIESTINLKQILKNLGVELLFKDFASDLSGIAGQKGDLVVSEVLQKTFVDVNEEGIEAAAATFSMVSVPRMGFIGDPEEFIADHPFIFYIKVKGVVIFAGRVTDPTH